MPSHAAHRQTLTHGVTIQGAVCPRCDAPLVYGRRHPTGVGGAATAFVVVCSRPGCDGPRRVTAEEVFRGPPPNPAA